MPMFRRSLFVLLAIALIAIGATAFTLSKEDTVQPLAAGTAPAAETVTVYVTGAVRRPGVVTLAGGRIEQAITACGGALPDADLARINLAQPLKDGMQIEVPGALRENLPEPEAQNSPAAKQDGLIHINTADEKTLEGLPGIGPVMARRIVEHRKQNGPFEKLEDLRKVRGIGEAKFARLKDKAAL